MRSRYCRPPLPKKGITLIGMPGCGKSTLGKRLAEKLEWKFVDIDRSIEEQYRCTLQQLLDQVGADGFRKIEEQFVLHQPNLKDTVLSPGGSIVESPAALSHIKAQTDLIYIHMYVPELQQRLKDTLHTRGIVGIEGGLQKLCEERCPKYFAAANANFCSHKLTEDQSLRELCRTVASIRHNLDHILS